jgi:hypothetical protein
MITRKLALAAAFIFAGGTAFADPITVQDVIAEYPLNKFTRVEVKDGLTQIKVEAFRDTGNGFEKVEVIWDKASGLPLKTETGPAGFWENKSADLRIRSVGGDFLRVDDDSNDDDEDGDDSDDDNSDDDSSDDDSSGGSDDSDDDSNDDNGGDSDGSDDSSDDDSNDDNGSDDSSDNNSGSDDNGDDD